MNYLNSKRRYPRIVLWSALQVTTGPRTLFSYCLQGQYFPKYLCCPQQCSFLDNFQLHFHVDSLVLLKVDWYGSKSPNSNRHNNNFSHAPDFCSFIFQQLVFLYLLKFLLFHPVITWDGNINHDNLSLLLINKDNVWSSSLNFPITLDCEVPQYFEIFTFHHSLRLLFIPAISSFQSTFTTKLPVDIPCHIIMSSFIFCLRQLTALTHHMGHGFSLTSAHSTQRGFCCVINMKSRIICFQSLFLGAAYQGLRTNFQISFSNQLPSSFPINTFLFSPMHSFLQWSHYMVWSTD